MSHAIKLKPGKDVQLDDLPSLSTGGLDKAQGIQLFNALGQELQDLQELMYGAAEHSVLIVVQGRDTAGKDGGINALLSHLDAMGTRVSAFKAPSADELSRDFLWRIHREVPSKGIVGLFNRSHYEDVLVSRVHQWISEPTCRQRYKHINHFEQLLVDTNTLLIKCFLHISKDEQAARLLEREKNPAKSWKLAISDWEDREKWDDYTRAYEQAMEHCSEAAPWHVIPADKKWFRNLAMTQLLVETLRPHRESWQNSLLRRGDRSRAELEAWRQKRSAQRP